MREEVTKFKQENKRIFTEDNFEKKHQKIMSQLPELNHYLKEKNKLISESDKTTPEFRFLYEEPLLLKTQEYHLFRQLNYLKYKIFNTKNISYAYKLLSEVIEIRKKISCANMRLVVNLTKKLIKSNDRNLLSEAISDGMIGLMKAIDYFDYRKGFKFSTYATWVIMDHVNKNEKKQNVNKEKFQTGTENILNKQIIDDDEQYDYDHVYQALELIPNENQKNVLKEYYGFNGESKKLKQIAQKMKISKERVRQIKNNGLANIREYLA